ncbi:DUF3630 family protein [Thalassotalea sp. M1531]|uniref:DUF3630 family protein n=1 Tax=Thalassotalea algicola TaxID=2716224 RepID=A0A7Y0Q5Z3_9GAMM|nr:DUF3630 family protein [Thalassotalea algicola]NMP30636.1 DUF3630 family protein [Thalassotalea algicola]
MQQLNSENIFFTQDNIEIRLSESFDDEDIQSLVNLVLNEVDGAKIIEHIPGADRYNVRFTVLASNFVLNFEVYSQSCWIELESGDGEELVKLNQLIKK